MIDHIDRNEALRYLACHDESGISETAAKYLDECENRVLKAIEPKYVYRYFPLSVTDRGINLAGTGIILSGKDIDAHLEGCCGAVIMAVTVGAGADRLIRQLGVEDMAKAVIADAMCGAAVEQLCNEAEGEIRKLFPDKYFTWRYSPGYGDFPLDTQKSLLNVIEAHKRIGLSLLESMLLTPVKSVTAVTGVSESPLPKRSRGCVTCNMRDTCQFRKRGSHCGF